LINDVAISDEDNVKEESLEKVQEGLTEYSKCDYEEAIKLFQEAIVLDSLNMEAYSSLAIAYKKLGDKEKSIDYYEKSIDAVVKCNALMNDNKDLLLDREVKAATYYNAGLARQKMAELYEEQGNSKMAQFQYTKAKQNYTTALDNAEMENMDEKRQEIYRNAVESMKKAMEKYKTQSLLNGREKIQEQTELRVLNKEILATKHGMFA
jgi:tetratricopeptide (TPR) repeat protein